MTSTIEGNKLHRRIRVKVILDKIQNTGRWRRKVTPELAKHTCR